MLVAGVYSFYMFDAPIFSVLNSASFQYSPTFAQIIIIIFITRVSRCTLSMILYCYAPQAVLIVCTGVGGMAVPLGKKCPPRHNILGYIVPPPPPPEQYNIVPETAPGGVLEEVREKADVKRPTSTPAYMQ